MPNDPIWPYPTQPNYSGAGRAGSRPGAFTSDPSATVGYLYEEPADMAQGHITLRLILGNPNASTAPWGGANVYLSHDDTSYALFAQTAQRSIIGELTAQLAAGAGGWEPASTCDVDISASPGTLVTTGAADAQAGVNLCLIGDEICSFETALPTGANTYTLTGFQRAWYGTTEALHAVGARFAMLSPLQLRVDLPISAKGQSWYWKVASLNIGRVEMALSASTLQAFAGIGLGATFSAISTPATPAAGNFRLYGLTTQGHTRPAYLDDDGIEMVLGRDNFLIVRNTSGSPMTKGQVVYVTGSTGNVPNVALAKADSLTTLPAVGVLHADLADNAYGHALKLALLVNFNTSAFSAGDRVYVSATVAGAMTATRPVSPLFAQRVGSVLVSGVGNGSLQVSIAPFIGGEESGTTVDWLAGATVTLPNTGLHLLDTDASHDLIIKPGSNLTADRILTITTGDAARLLSLLGDLYVEAESRVNQDLTTDGNVTFGTVLINSASNQLTLQENNGQRFAIADTSGATNCSWDIDALTAAGTDLVALRFFRSTNTSGTRVIQIFKGDNSATVTLSINVATGAITSSGSITAALDMAVAATKRLYLDGVAMSGDTYIVESSANVLDIYAGGTNVVKFNATGISLFGGVPAAQRAAYTQTYSTASRTVATITYVAPAGGATIDTQCRASLAQLAADCVNLRQLIGSLIDDSQALGWAT